MRRSNARIMLGLAGVVGPGKHSPNADIHSHGTVTPQVYHCSVSSASEGIWRRQTRYELVLEAELS